MDQSQGRRNVNVNFEGEFAHYFIEMAKVQNKTIEVVKDLVEEEIEARKLSEADDEIDEVDIELAQLSLERDTRGDEEIRSEDVDWDRILSAKTV